MAARSRKASTLREIRRVLKPGGRVEFVDFTGTQPHGGIGRLLHPHRRLRAKSETRLLEFLTSAGFANAILLDHQTTAFGRVALLQGSS